jgi:hypothetical protein
LKYPEGYSDLEHFIKDHLYVDDAETDKTYLCLTIKDGVDHKVVLGNLENVTEMTKHEMVEYCEPHEEKRETITDEAKVRRLAIKAQLGQPFTTEELKALDPEDETPGFGYTKRFIDRI